MPFHPVTAALMYRGIYTVPNLLSEQRPVDIPEDELEGECPAGPPPAGLLPVRPGGARSRGAGAGGRPQVPAARWALRRAAARGVRTNSHLWVPRWAQPRRRAAGPLPAGSPALRKLAEPRSGVTGPRRPR